MGQSLNTFLSQKSGPRFLVIVIDGGSTSLHDNFRCLSMIALKRALGIRARCISNVGASRRSRLGPRPQMEQFDGI